MLKLLQRTVIALHCRYHASIFVSADILRIGSKNDAIRQFAHGRCAWLIAHVEISSICQTQLALKQRAWFVAYQSVRFTLRFAADILWEDMAITA